MNRASDPGAVSSAGQARPQWGRAPDPVARRRPMTSSAPVPAWPTKNPA